MPVSITFSATSGGAGLGEPVDFGARANGQIGPNVDVHLRHDGTNPITSVGFYLSEFSGVYTGGATAAADLAELRGWGDSAVNGDFGGVQVNQDAVGAFPSASWPTFDSHTRGQGAVFNTSQGSSASNAIALAVASGASVAGQVQAGASPNVRVRTRVQIPLSETVTGVRLFGLTLVYTYTS